MRTVVVGAGLAGLVAAQQLAAAGHDVVVFDKGRSPGGRMATRRIDGATVDHGAQFFTVRSERFDEMVQPWLASGLVREWCRGFSPGGGDGYPRYAVTGGMTALPKHLAAGLDVRCNSFVFAVRRGESAGTWQVDLDDGSHVMADRLVVTCPLPQTFALLVSAEVEMPEALWRTDYDRTLCLLAVLDRPSAVAEPGGLQGEPGFTFIADNQRKGISTVPALTLHADPEWSEAHWDDDPADALDELEVLAAPYIGDAGVVARQLKRWRFATPRSIWPDACWVADGDGATGTLVCAGDAFAGPRVEGAVLSGLAAAAAVRV
jgi:predicted NAD/FAD-dependent oxidoreductase